MSTASMQTYASERRSASKLHIEIMKKALGSNT